MEEQRTERRSRRQQGLSPQGVGDEDFHDSVDGRSVADNQNRSPSPETVRQPEPELPRQTRTIAKTPSVVFVKEETTKIKVDKLKDLSVVSIRTFLHQVALARKQSQDICASAYLSGEALEKLDAKCLDCTDDFEVISTLKELIAEEERAAVNRPTSLVQDRLKWSDSTKLSNDQKHKKFFDDLQMLTKESHKAGVLDQGLNRERVTIAAVEKLPKELGIRAEDVRIDSRLLDDKHLRSLVESRLPLLRPGRSAARRVNQVCHEEPYHAHPVHEQYSPHSYHRPVSIPVSYAHSSTQSEASLAYTSSSQSIGPEQSQFQLNNVNRPNQGVGHQRMEPHRATGAFRPQPAQRRMNDVVCWICNNQGHLARECPRPKNAQFYQKLKEFRMASRPNRLFHIDTEHKQPADLQVYSKNGQWIPVSGTLDSGAEGNVAPASLRDQASQVYTMSTPVRYQLPNGTVLETTSEGRLLVQSTTGNGTPFHFGSIPVHFIEDPNWKQLLVGRPTLSRHNLLPEQAISRLQEQQQPINQ